MGYSRQQFQALFWKNWLCRVRQPVLCLSEVLWPCILFLILAAVRYQEPPKFIQKCYLEPRNLPSHGLYPFVQSLFCNAGSRCKNSSHTEVRSSAPRAARLETGQNNPFENEEAFLRELQDLADGILEITTKATSLQELWEGDEGGLGAVVFADPDWETLSMLLGFLSKALTSASFQISGTVTVLKELLMTDWSWGAMIWLALLKT
ncbi:ATP-binding cassette sub-family A member 13-like [Pleurodeles waltl]|uniref:ATP-binding cassette sub-family A member 13-like n=1 Tax=Pleurodeles waltl TaxID=8319 RepID=UPI003709679E